MQAIQPSVLERWTWRRFVGAALAACISAPLLGCGDSRPTDGAVAVQSAHISAAPTAMLARPDAIKLGRKVYNFRCYFCHGYSGDARTLAATYLTPKPRDFAATAPDALSRASMIASVHDGRAGTAMKGFAGILSAREIEAVTDFVRHEFMASRAENTRYHTAANGWPDHERNQVAFAFARGDIALDTPWGELDAEQQRGKRLFLGACITCHDHGRVSNPGSVWESRPVTYPRDAYCTSCHQEAPRAAPTGAAHPTHSAPNGAAHPATEAPAGAAHPTRAATHTFTLPDGSVPLQSPNQAGTDGVAGGYLVHDQRPALANASPLERRGEALFQKNCAFCHAADGTSKGWIGSFLEPHPRDLTSAQQMQGMTKERLARSINEGLPGTSMPAWNGVLVAADIEALMAYISRAFHSVAGVAAATPP